MTFQLRKRLKMGLGGLAARCCGRPGLTGADVLALSPRRILVVRPHNQMGDMVCATPTFRAIREAFPGAELALVCAPLNWEVVRNNPDFAHVFVFAKKEWTRLGRMLRFSKQLREFCPDLAFVLNSVSYSLTSTFIAVLSGAPVIVGGDSAPFGWDVSRHAYSLVLPGNPVVDRHAVLHSLAPLAAIGISTGNLDTVVVPAPAEREQARDLLAEVPGSGPLWVLHPGAGKPPNRWPAERFAAGAARAAGAGNRLLVLQGPMDGEVMARFRQALDDPGRRPTGGEVFFAPAVVVGVCAAVLEAARLFLCNDSGLMHVAGAVGVPTLALFGPTDPVHWKPLADSVVAIRAAGGDLDRLPVADVWQALQELPPRQRE